MKLTKRILGVFTLIVAVVLLAACNPKVKDPQILGADNKSVPRYSAFDPKAGVTAKDGKNKDITDLIVIEGTVNTDEPAVYELKYSVEDENGRKAEVIRKITVTDEDATGFVYANYLAGVNYDYLPATEKAKFFAAAENYLLENVYAGVPLYRGASRVIFSERVSLFSEDYNGVMGFGTAFSELTQDDSNVLMYGDTKGNPGEYTWRATFSTDPQTFNGWIGDDSVVSDHVDMFTGALYDFHFDETKTGYEIVPSLAKSEPIPVDKEVINGKEYAKIWQMPVRDDLEWKYHPQANTADFPKGHEKLDANDWLWTWKHALKNSWFRARTGGGDFVSKGVVGATEYLDSPTEENWEKVGLKVVDGNTLQIEFKESISAFDFKYGFAGSIVPALNQHLVELYGDDYGTSPTTVASSGIYYLDTHTNGQLILYKKNELHPDSELYHYTGYQYRFVEGSDAVFAEFEAGRLESASIPTARVDEFLNDERVKVSPDATTWRMSMNAFGTPEARDAYIAKYPGVGLDESYVPKAILSYTEMRQALYYGLNRQHMAEEVAKTYLPAHTLFAPTYFLDGSSGLSVRGTPEGQDTLSRFVGDTFGYVPDAAKDLYKEAVRKAIADGHYEKGTADNYTVIDLSFWYASSGSTSAEAAVQYLKESYESLLVDDENFVRVTISVENITFPQQYYNYAMKANGDLYLGGISGSLLNAPSFLNVFTDDNRGNFTLNWGIDTSTANIPVEYTNLEGKAVKEYWSFNAIYEVLQRKTYVKNGQEQKDWSNVDDLIEAYQDMNNDDVKSITDGEQELAEAVIGKTYEEIMEDKGYSEVVAKIVVNSEDESILYVVGKVGNNWELVSRKPLITDARKAIETGFEYELDIDPVLLDSDEAIEKFEYFIEEELPFETLQDIADEYSIPVEQLRVYATTYTYEGVQYTDAAVLKQVGDFYVYIDWL